MNLGEKVKKRRLELNLTQEELAKKMGYCTFDKYFLKCIMKVQRYK
jgi:transcriptional regulator with XRE-family HTH domain